MENKIRIGSVADLYNISKQTLIHYDRIGLLKPSYVEENKYRYYTFNDIDKLEMIISLKNAGLSLNDIKAYMKKPSLDESIDLLVKQQATLAKHIRDLQRTKERIDYKIEELNQIKNLKSLKEPVVISKKTRHILSEIIPSDSDYDVMDGIRSLKSYVEETERYQKYLHFFEGVMVKKSAILLGQFHEIYKTFIFIDKNEGYEKEESLEAKDYVCIHHYGPYEETHVSYKKILDFINNHLFEIDGDAIEIPLITAWASVSDNSYITEIQVPIKKKSD